MRVSWGKWREWPTNANSQAFSSPWICPIGLKIFNREIFGVFICRCDEHAFFSGGKLNKMSISNINNHQKTIESYFCSVWYGEDIIMGLYFLDLHIVWRCEHISSIQMFFHTYVASVCIHYDILHWNSPFSWKTSIVWHLSPKCYTTKNTTFK